MKFVVFQTFIPSAEKWSELIISAIRAVFRKKRLLRKLDFPCNILSVFLLGYVFDREIVVIAVLRITLLLFGDKDEMS